MKKILKTLIDSEAILEGHFLLTSGRHSNVYIEKFRVLEDPLALDAVCRAMSPISNCTAFSLPSSSLGSG